MVYKLAPKTTNNSLMLKLLTNETILANQLLNEKQNDSLSVFTFNGSKKQVKLILPNLLKIYEMSKKQIQPFIKEQGKNIVHRRFKKQISAITRNKVKMNEIMPKRIPQFELSRIKSLTKKVLQLFTEQQIPYFTKNQIQALTEKQIKNSQQLLLIKKKKKKQLVIFNATTINDFDLQNQTVTTELNQQRPPKL